MAGIKLFKVEPTATTDQIRNFVKEAKTLDEKIREKRRLFVEEIKANDKIIEIDEELKRLKAERKEFIETSMAFEKVRGELDDLMTEKKQLISDAKDDGVPQKEITEAIKMLQKDIDPQVTTEIYSNISDLVD